jgi:hypothetical protein
MAVLTNLQLREPYSCDRRVSVQHILPVPLFSPSRRAVSLDDGTVDEDQTIFSFFGERIKDALPNATLPHLL